MNINGIILFDDIKTEGINNLIKELIIIISGKKGRYSSINRCINWVDTCKYIGYSRSDFANLYRFGEDKILAQDLLNRLTYEIKEEDVL